MKESLLKLIKVSNGGVIINGIYLSIPNIELKRTLPPGANGIVFEAHDKLLDRRVAVKIWIPSKRDRRDRSEQALAEASKLAQLDHKNIGRIYVAGVASGYIYSIMEYIDGVTLRDFLNSAESSLQNRCSIWDQIEDALRYAYAKGIYHGDLHDRNVIIVGGSPKIIDFGTSIFAPTKLDARYRESRVLREFTERLFSKDTPKLGEIIDEDIDLSTLMPEATLSALSAWRSLIATCAEIVMVKATSTPHNDSEDKLWPLTFNLSPLLCKVPIFSMHKMEPLLTNLGSPANILNLVFKRGVNVWAKSKLAEMFPQKGVPTENVADYETYKAEWLKRAKVI